MSQLAATHTKSTQDYCVTIDRATLGDNTNTNTFKEPLGRKLDELISYGIIVVDGNNETKNIRFKHRSFAEFVYATILTSEITPQDLRNFMFSVGYVYGQNVQQFVSGALRKQKEENADYQMVIVSMGWTKWVNDQKLRDFRGDEEDFMHSILSHSVGYKSDRNVTKLLLSDVDDGLFLKWLRQVDKDWARNNVFDICLGNEEINEIIVPVLVALMFSTKEDVDLSDILSDSQVKHSLLKYPRLIDDTCKWLMDTVGMHEVLGITHLRSKAQRLLTEEHTKKMLWRVLRLDSEFLAKVVDDLELSQWYSDQFNAEELSELLLHFSARKTDIAWTKMNSVGRSFGNDMIPGDILKFRCKFGSNEGCNIFEIAGQVDKFNSNIFWKTVNQTIIDNPLDASKVAVASSFVNITLLLKNLEPQISSACQCKIISDIFPAVPENLSNVHFNQAKIIVREFEKLEEWIEKLEDMISCVVPYLILYCNNKAEPARRLMENSFDWGNDFDSAVRSIFAASILSEESEVFQLVVSSMRDLQTEHSHLLQILVNTDQSELRNLISLSCKSSLQSICVGEFPIWEIIIKILLNLKKKSIEDLVLQETSWIMIFRNILMSISCCNLNDCLTAVKEIVPQQTLELLLRSDQVIQSVKEGTKKYAENNIRVSGNENICALLNIIQFYNKNLNRESLKDVLTSLVSSLPVELLTVGKALNEIQGPEECDLQVQIDALVRDEFPRPLTLRRLAEEEQLNYRTKADWECLFNALQLQSTAEGEEYSSSTPYDHIYEDKWSPLLRAWAEFFGVDKTLKEAQEPVFGSQATNLWKVARNDMTDGNLLIVAVEFGSEEAVQLVSWPGFLSWTNENGKTPHDIAVEMGNRQKIAEFLENKRPHSKSTVT